MHRLPVAPDGSYGGPAVAAVHRRRAAARQARGALRPSPRAARRSLTIRAGVAGSHHNSSRDGITPVRLVRAKAAGARWSGPTPTVLPSVVQAARLRDPQALRRARAQ